MQGVMYWPRVNIGTSDSTNRTPVRRGGASLCPEGTCFPLLVGGQYITQFIMSACQRQRSNFTQYAAILYNKTSCMRNSNISSVDAANLLEFETECIFCTRGFLLKIWKGLLLLNHDFFTVYYMLILFKHRRIFFY